MRLICIMAIICRIFAPRFFLIAKVMNTIKIRVLSVLPDGKFRELYRQSVPLPDGISFPYDEVVRVLKVLYPKCDFVEICV